MRQASLSSEAVLNAHLPRNFRFCRRWYIDELTLKDGVALSLFGAKFPGITLWPHSLIFLFGGTSLQQTAGRVLTLFGLDRFTIAPFFPLRSHDGTRVVKLRWKQVFLSADYEAVSENAICNR